MNEHWIQTGPNTYNHRFRPYVIEEDADGNPTIRDIRTNSEVLDLSDFLALPVGVFDPLPAAPDLTPLESRLDALEGATVARPLVIPLGPWNMDASSNHTVDTPGPLAIASILNIRAHIVNDFATVWTDLFRPDASYANLEGRVNVIDDYGTYLRIQLQRRTGGFYDSNVYDSVAISRGYLSIIYEGPAT